MRDYPIGSFLVWKPGSGQPVRTRRFVKDYVAGVRTISGEETVQPAPYLVLDGQQRLQSLYLAFFGSYDGKRLYFKVDSDPSKEESDNRYQFEFLTSMEANKDHHWVQPQHILKIDFPKIGSHVDSTFGGDLEPRKERIKENFARFVQVFNIVEKLPVLEVKEEMPYDDVLEVFVRINSGGIVLTKSDLVFSTVVLKLPDMEGRFVQLTDELNGGGEFDFDIDFITRASFVLLGMGAKYEIKKLQDGTYLVKLQSEFDRLRKSLLSTIHFLKNDARILSSKFLKSDLALIPIADFLFAQNNQQIPEGQSTHLRKYLYMSFFMRFYSHGADAKLDFVHNSMSTNKIPNEFPVGPIGTYMTARTGAPFDFSSQMLNDVDLVLNIIQGGVSEIPKLRGWSLDKDHIFPRALLEKIKVPPETIDRVGNLRLVNKTRNIVKSDNMPETNLDFFGSNDSAVRTSFLEARGSLTQKNYEIFVNKREALMMQNVKGFLGI